MDSDSQIIEKLLSGASLRTVMTPDDDIPGNRPLHDEHFDLPHVIINDGTFFGITKDSLLLNHNKDEPAMAFYYSNLEEIFGVISPIDMFFRQDKKINFLIASQKRYKQHQWKIKSNSELVWEFTGDKNNGKLREAICCARKLTVALLDEEDVWNIHPIALPQINRKSDGFILKSEYSAYPYLFRNPPAMKDFMKNHIEKGYFSNKSQYLAYMNKILHQPFFAFYHISPDGTYKSYYDLRRGNTTNKYSNLKIFAEI